MPACFRLEEEEELAGEVQRLVEPEPSAPPIVGTASRWPRRSFTFRGCNRGAARRAPVAPARTRDGGGGDAGLLGQFITGGSGRASRSRRTSKRHRSLSPPPQPMTPPEPAADCRATAADRGAASGSVGILAGSSGPAEDRSAAGSVPPKPTARTGRRPIWQRRVPSAGRARLRPAIPLAAAATGQRGRCAWN